MLEDSGPAVQPSSNRCGHDPAAPRWFEPPERHKPRPGIRERREACLGVVGCLVHYLDLLTAAFGPLRAYYEYGQAAGLRYKPLYACRYRRPRNAWARGWPDGQDHRFRLEAFQQARLRLEQPESPHQGPVPASRPR
jgi:hypothetical protein